MPKLQRGGWSECQARLRRTAGAEYGPSLCSARKLAALQSLAASLRTQSQPLPTRSALNQDTERHKRGLLTSADGTVRSKIPATLPSVRRRPNCQSRPGPHPAVRPKSAETPAYRLLHATSTLCALGRSLDIISATLPRRPIRRHNWRGHSATCSRAE